MITNKKINLSMREPTHQEPVLHISWWNILINLMLSYLILSQHRFSRETTQKAASQLLVWTTFSCFLTEAQPQPITTPFPDIFDLTSLDGKNGFKIVGNFSEEGGQGPATTAGDVNNDGIADLIVSRPGASPNGVQRAGEVYVVFGDKLEFNSTLLLSNIDGKNGFILEGSDAFDYLGISVSSAGDFNGDGVDDIIIGASNGGSSSRVAKSYIIFGRKFGFNKRISLANLNGSDGFLLKGLNTINGDSHLVSTAGDFNGDGVTDVVIGMTNSAVNGVFLVFGKKTIFNASLSLANLNGLDGVKIDGITAQISSIACTGDVNNDGISDIIIGTPAAYPSMNQALAGVTYVVFGKKSGFSPTFSISNLNGNNGFRLDGILEDDHSGSSVAAAEDINGDGVDDIIIGAPAAGGFNNSGESYIVFGSKSGFNSNFSFAELNGSNGFTIMGFGLGTYSGSSVAEAGDINSDGVADVIIVAGNMIPSGKFSIRCHVIFGKKTSFSAKLDLATFDDRNGFKISGVNALDGIKQVAKAGDVNGDGVDDVIISGLEGYVIFGRRVHRNLEIKSNQLNLEKAGETRFIRATDLVLLYELASKNLLGTLNITFTDVTRGEFKINNIHQSSSFSIQQSVIANQLLSFTHDGSDELPSYQVAVTDGRSQVGPSKVRVVLQTRNDIELTQDEPLLLNDTMLAVKLSNRTAEELRYDITQAISIQFSFLNDGSLAQNFTQAQIDAQMIVLESNSVSLRDPTQTPKFSFNIIDAITQTFITQMEANLRYYLKPIITANRLVINKPGETIIFGSQQLGVSYGEDSGSDLIITISNVIGGAFKLNGQAQSAPFQFKASVIQQRFLSFTQDGSKSLPVYEVSVTDGHRVVGPLRADVIAPFANQQAPQLINNQMNLSEGEHKRLTRENLLAIDDMVTNPALIRYLLISESLNHLLFNQIKLNRSNIEEFSQKDVDDEVIEIVNDGEDAIPSVSFQVSDGQLTGMATKMNITFNANQEDPPVLRVNEVLLTQGEVIPVTTSWIIATDSDASDENKLIIKVISSTHGYFRKVGADYPLNEFSFTVLTANQIEFVHDGSTEAPQISLQASDGILNSEMQMVAIKFVQGGSNSNTIAATLGSVGGVLCCAGLFAVGFVVYRKRQADESRKGNDINIVTARRAYEELNISGVANFNSGNGLTFVDQITEINQGYQQVYGEAEDVNSYIVAMVKAIKETLSADSDVASKGNSIAFNIADTEKRQPLRRQREAIMERCHIILNGGSQVYSNRVDDIAMQVLS